MVTHAEEQARYRATHREILRERGRSDYWADPEPKREAQRRRMATPEGKAAQARRNASPEGKAAKFRVKHGMNPDDWAAMWAAQGGRCYLCGDDLPERGRGVHVDHDHSCCPYGKSCACCRRGLSCRNCNAGIGMFGDDPARMRLVADNLEAAKLAAAERMASKPVQGMLE